MKNVTSKVANIENWTLKKKKRGLKVSGRFSKGWRGSKVTLRNLEKDFEREVEGERSLETDEVPQSQVRGAPKPSHRSPTSSVARTTSVLIGWEIDWLNKIWAQVRGQANCKKRKGALMQGGPTPSQHDEWERSHHLGSRLERSPPRHSRLQSRLRKNEDEVESGIWGNRRNDHRTSLHDDNYERGARNEDD